MQLVDLAMMLEKQTGGRFATERRIRQDRGLAVIGARGHVPDGLLKIDGQKPTAIELELSTKGWRRLKSFLTKTRYHTSLHSFIHRAIAANAELEN